MCAYLMLLYVLVFFLYQEGTCVHLTCMLMSDFIPSTALPLASPNQPALEEVC